MFVLFDGRDPDIHEIQDDGDRRTKSGNYAIPASIKFADDTT